MDNIKTTSYFFVMSIALAIVAGTTFLQGNRQANEIIELRSEVKELRNEVSEAGANLRMLTTETLSRLNTHRDQISDLQRSIRPRTGAVGSSGSAGPQRAE